MFSSKFQIIKISSYFRDFTLDESCIPSVKEVFKWISARFIPVKFKMEVKLILYFKFYWIIFVNIIFRVNLQFL